MLKTIANASQSRRGNQPSPGRIWSPETCTEQLKLAKNKSLERDRCAQSQIASATAVAGETKTSHATRARMQTENTALHGDITVVAGRLKALQVALEQETQKVHNNKQMLTDVQRQPVPEISPDDDCSASYSEEIA